MKRRSFLRSGVVAGLAGITSPAILAGWGPSPTASPASRPKDVPDPPLRLHHAENPRGLAPAAREAIVNALPGASQYGSSARAEVTRTIAESHAVDVEFIAIGNGSTDTLRQAPQAVGKPGMHLVAADPTYGDIFRYVQPLDARVTRVPLRADYSHDIPAMRRAVAQGGSPALVYICQPNNPTGTLTDPDEIDQWIEEADQENVYFVVDEAFHYYVDDPRYRSADRWVHRRPNVIVARTFSKIYALAGLRLGYGIAHPDTAERMRTLWAGGISHLTAVAALASMEDGDWVRDTMRLKDEAKAITQSVLDELGIEYIPTQTNFLMHRIKGQLATHQERMRDHGVLVGRAFPPMEDYNRVGLGLPDSMEYYGQVLHRFRARDWI